ncbi:MAG: DUF349 domain-containing protein [Prevotellamassilia sp.]
MDEIKNTTEVDETIVSTPNVEENATENQTLAEMPEPTDKAGVIAQLKEIVYNNGEVERGRLERLKMLYYRFQNADVVAAREQFIANGGAAEDFIPAPDADEENFKAQYALVRELRQKAAEELEQQKQENLKRKLEIIERIKTLANSPEEADKGYDEVKQLQTEWKEIKLVPAENATELWKNYQLYVEQYYDQLRLNHEMRAYDFKKNLEIKTHLCEAAEKLAEVDDVISAFHQLQNLHQEYRETGPVAKELREELWKRFKDASTVINKRHQDHFESLKARDEENLLKKTELCQKVEAIELDKLTTRSQWENVAKEVMGLQAEWKSIGFAPRKVNTEIYERFRMACDRFFQARTAFNKVQRERQDANIEVKKALIEKAEALKESTDWGSTTTKLVELQKEWKATPAVHGKLSESLWKRFNTACNYFFDRKNEANKGVKQEEQANLELKKAVLAELEKLVETPADNQLQAVRDLQNRWGEIGHVPFNKKEKMYRRYRELCDKIYDALHESAGHRRMDNFRKNMADKGGNELTRERAKLQAAYDAKKQDIQNYETNLSFFRASSKKGNSLVSDIEKKIERLKEDLQEISAKMKAINEQIKAEEGK